MQDKNGLNVIKIESTETLPEYFIYEHYTERKLEIAKTLARITNKLFPYLYTRKSDSLDFEEIAVWELKKMVTEAYKAGARKMLETTDKKSLMKEIEHFNFYEPYQ